MSRFAWLLWLLPMLAPAQDGGTAPELSVEAVRFTVANAEFTLMHEMGHLLISELQLPVLGRERTPPTSSVSWAFPVAAGTAPRRFLRQADGRRRLLAYGMAERGTRRLPVPVWDSHALDAQRFYNIACLAYGSDPDRLDWVLEVSGLPVERALYCPDEYEQVAHAVQWFREHFGRSAAQPAATPHQGGLRDPCQR